MTALPEFLSTWITEQRWYAGKGRAPVWRRLGGFDLPDPEGQAHITVHLLLDEAERPLLYQVPLAERSEPVAGLEHALIGSYERNGAIRFVYDGPRDEACAQAMLRLILDEGAALPDDGAPGVAARGHRVPMTPAVEIRGARVLSGEQSNTSIIYDLVGRDGTPATPVICKVFRSLHHGENPDVTLLSALAGAGSSVVPRSVGHITGQWHDTGEPTGFAHGHLAFAQEFFPGAPDAWRVALESAEAGDDFAERARTLGEATADVHITLAAALPARPAAPSDIAATIASMRARFDEAVAEVPAIARHRAALQSVYARAATVAWPVMQRIHGDFHLGQVLWVPRRGWIILDFEGEPMRPMLERAREDFPLRDVAGMLRSFDYVAGSVAAADGRSATDWAQAARRAFLDGYISRSGADLRANRFLLDAFEIDKALYEAVYEARNRPAWLSIPLAAIDRLVERAAA